MYLIGQCLCLALWCLLGVYLSLADDLNKLSAPGSDLMEVKHIPYRHSTCVVTCLYSVFWSCFAPYSTQNVHSYTSNITDITDFPTACCKKWIEWQNFNLATFGLRKHFLKVPSCSDHLSWVMTAHAPNSVSPATDRCTHRPTNNQ